MSYLLRIIHSIIDEAMNDWLILDEVNKISVQAYKFMICVYAKLMSYK